MSQIQLYFEVAYRPQADVAIIQDDECANIPVDSRHHAYEEVAYRSPVLLRWLLSQIFDRADRILSHHLHILP